MADYVFIVWCNDPKTVRQKACTELSQVSYHDPLLLINSSLEKTRDKDAVQAQIPAAK